MIMGKDKDIERFSGSKDIQVSISAKGIEINNGEIVINYALPIAPNR
jgi:hypothetical protein